MKPAIFTLFLIATLTACAGLPAAPAAATAVDNAPATQAATATLPSAQVTPDLPTPEPPRPLVWLTNPVDHILLGVDAEENRLAKQISLPDRAAVLSSGSGSPWVVMTNAGGGENLLRIDPALAQISAVTPVPAGQTVLCLAVDGNTLWMGLQIDDRIGEGRLLRVENGQLDQAAALEPGGVPLQIESTADGLWVLVDDGAFSHFAYIAHDGSNTRILSDDGSRAPYVLSTFALVNNTLWAASPVAPAPYLFEIDPANGAILRSLGLGSGAASSAVDLAPGPDNTLLALQRSGAVVVIDPVQAQIIGQIDLPHGADRLLHGFGAVWAQNTPRALLYRLDTTRLQIAGELTTGSPMPPTPVPAPTRKPGEEVCQGDYPSNLSVGLQAMVKPDPPVPNRVRVKPDRNSQLLGEIAPGEEVLVTDGPVCVEGWVWWQISARGGELAGWTAEGDGGDYWLVPAP